MQTESAEKEAPAAVEVPPPNVVPPPEKSTPKAPTSLKTPKLSDLMNGKSNEAGSSAADQKNQVQYTESYTDEQLQRAWNEFAEKRKIYQAEYYLLTQPFDRNGDQLTIHLHNPVQETLLGNIKGDLTAFLRDTLKNSLITVAGELREETDERKVLYTDKDKLEYLLKKNPALKELKDRLELDTDY